MNVEMVKLDDLRRFMQLAIAEIGADFATPADDWISVLAVQSKRGIEIMNLPGEMFATAHAKDLLGELLRMFVADRGAYRYALLLNAHGKPIDPTDPESQELLERLEDEHLRIEQLEGATELLLLLVGDAEQEQVWKAEIGRDEAMIRILDEWQRMDDDPDVGFSGRFSGLNAYLSLPRP